jgi:hypothetical protein
VIFLIVVAEAEVLRVKGKVKPFSEVHVAMFVHVQNN